MNLHNIINGDKYISRPKKFSPADPRRIQKKKGSNNPLRCSQRMLYSHSGQNYWNFTDEEPKKGLFKCGYTESLLGREF